MDGMKASLTVEERIKAAYYHYVMHLDLASVAQILMVNQGRVSECCTAIIMAAADPLRFREMMKAAKPAEKKQSPPLTNEEDMV